MRGGSRPLRQAVGSREVVKTASHAAVQPVPSNASSLCAECLCTQSFNREPLKKSSAPLLLTQRANNPPSPPITTTTTTAPGPSQGLSMRIAADPLTSCCHAADPMLSMFRLGLAWLFFFQVLEHRCALFSPAASRRRPCELTLETIFVPPGEDGKRGDCVSPLLSN